MRARELQATLAARTEYAAGEIDQRTRHLYQMSLIRSGPRGVHAPHMEPLEAALILLCLVARRPTEAGQVMARAMDLAPVLPPNVTAWPFDTLRSLTEFLMLPLSGHGGIVNRIEVLCDGSMAWVEFTQAGLNLRVLFTDRTDIVARLSGGASVYDETGAMYAGHRLVLTGALLDQLALELAHDATGYVVEPQQVEV